VSATRKSVIEPTTAVERGVARLVRRHDRDRFLTALFAPPERRGELLALYAFNHEVAKTREVVSEPTLGEIRLQWWRDGIDAIYAGNAPRRHEVLEPLAAAIRSRGLSEAHFARLLEARRRNLADEPPGSLAELEDYAEATSAGLVWLALEVLGERGDLAMAAGRATGMAQALIGLLRAVPLHARAKRVYLPRDLLAAAGLRVERDLFELRSSAALRDVVREIATAAGRHLATAEALCRAAPRGALPALLPAALAAADLKRLARAGYDPFAARMARSDPWRPLRLTLAALKSRLDGRDAAC